MMMMWATETKWWQ